MLSIYSDRTWNLFRAALGIAAGVVLLASCGQDSARLPSDPEPVNSRPVADAGTDRTSAWRDTVRLDGINSRDADGDPLTYQWDVLASPAGSGAALSDPMSATPHFIADLPGVFVVQLVVHDGVIESAPDTVAIQVDPLAAIVTSPLTIGAGLQLRTTAHLGFSDHGGITVRIASDDSLLALIAPDENTSGSGFIEMAVPDGADSLSYVVQAAAGTTGSTSVTTTASGVADGTATITVVQPGVVIDGLEASHWSVASDVFDVLVGIPDSAGIGLSEIQGTSAANGSPLGLTVLSTSGAVGHVSAGGATASTITVDLEADMSELGMVFVPQSGGTTTVSVSVPGFIATTGASVAVSVSVPAISPFTHTIGAGLQFAGSALLDTDDHGGVTVHIESNDPTVALVAPDENTPGTQGIDVFVADGADSAPYVVQGVLGTTGAVTITASAPGFASGARAITVVQPAVTILGLAGSHVLGINAGFTVLIGLPDPAGPALSTYQGVSAAVAPLVMTMTSTNGLIGHVSAAGVTGSIITVDLAAGVFESRVTFVPRAGGTTTVSAAIPGFVSTPGAAVQLTVDAAGITPFTRTIGSGLQYGDDADLTADDHGGVTVRLESSDSLVALIAPDVNTPGTPFIDVFVPNGVDVAPYVVQGVVGATGTVTVTASAPGFTSGTGTITVVQPAVMIFGLADSVSVGGTDGFTVFIGLPNVAGNGLNAFQGISAASPQPVVLTVTSSDGAVGDLSAGGPAGATITVNLTTGMFQPGAAFRAWSVGSTTVSASIPGFLPMTTATVGVTVIP